MRIVRFLASALVILAVVAASIFFVGREILLQLGMTEVRSGISAMRTAAYDVGIYSRQCQLKGVGFNEPALSEVRLRFLDDRRFVVEVICGSFFSDPLVIAEQLLPIFVEKMPGSSGLIWGQDQGVVNLEIFGRKRGVRLAGGEPVFGSVIDEAADIGTGPVSACQSYGFSCCSADSSVGQGTQITGVLDCPLTCYSQCLARPIVLSLTSDPFMDARTREVTVRSGEMVTFSYVVEAGAGPAITVTLDFGDGQAQSAETTTGTFSHTYACSSGSCVFEARLVALDGQDIKSADSKASQIKVVVN